MNASLFKSQSGYEEITFRCKMILQTILNAPEPLESQLDINRPVSISEVPIQYVTCDCLFQWRDGQVAVSVGIRRYHFVT